MILLYTGIYRVALDLHRRSEEKRRKQETSLAALAQHTVSHLGTAVIGITRTAKLDEQLIQRQQQQQQQQLQVQRQQVINLNIILLTSLYGAMQADMSQGKVKFNHFIYPRLFSLKTYVVKCNNICTIDSHLKH